MVLVVVVVVADGLGIAIMGNSMGRDRPLSRERPCWERTRAAPATSKSRELDGQEGRQLRWELIAERRQMTEKLAKNGPAEVKRLAYTS